MYIYVNVIINNCFYMEYINFLLSPSSSSSQGLSDPEEAVICEAISSMTVLCINGLFNLRFLISSLQQIVPFIAHPVRNNKYINNLIVCLCYM